VEDKAEKEKKEKTKRKKRKASDGDEANSNGNWTSIDQRPSTPDELAIEDCKVCLSPNKTHLFFFWRGEGALHTSVSGMQFPFQHERLPTFDEPRKAKKRGSRQSISCIHHYNTPPRSATPSYPSCWERDEEMMGEKSWSVCARATLPWPT